MQAKKTKSGRSKPRKKIAIKKPNLLDNMLASSSAIRKLEAKNNALLLRVRFDTSDSGVVSQLYTHLVLSWALVPNIVEQKVAYEQLTKGVLLLKNCAVGIKLEPEDFDRLCDIFQFSYEILSHSTVREIVKTCTAIKTGKLQIEFDFSQYDEPCVPDSALSNQDNSICPVSGQ